MELRGSTVLITGAARGIGAEAARRLAARGARVSWSAWSPTSSPASPRSAGPTRPGSRSTSPTGRRSRGRRGHRRALRRHRLPDRERRHRGGGHGTLDRPPGLRAHHRSEPARRLADGPRMPAARDRAARLRARDRVAGRRCARARDGGLLGQQGGGRGVRQLAARRGRASRRGRGRRVLRLHRHRSRAGGR